MSAERNSPRHDRESVTAAALKLLDEVGLPDLSMRRIASELEVQPSALYWHFESKQVLLAALADRILERPQAELAPGAALQDRVRTVAHGIRDALFSYRDGAELVQSSYALGLSGIQLDELLASAMRPEVPEADARTAGAALAQFVLGHASLVQQRLHASGLGAGAPQEDPDEAAPLERAFDAGLELMIAGLRASRVQSA